MEAPLIQIRFVAQPLNRKNKIKFLKNMSFKKIFLIIAIVIFVVVSFYLVYAAGRKIWPFKTKYQVVVLESGEVYFGKLSLFPNPRMTDVWVPQQTKDTNQPGLQILPLSSMYFGSDDVLYLEPSRISWWSNLRDDSQVVQIMTGKASGQTQTETTPQATSTPTPTPTPTQPTTTKK
jgi:nitrate reductase NapE component